MSREAIIFNLNKIKATGGDLNDAIEYLRQESRIPQGSTQNPTQFLDSYVNAAQDIFRREEPSALESVGRGMYDLKVGIPQALGMLSPEEEAIEREKEALYERNIGEGFDFGRLGGQAAATAIGGAPGLTARLGMIGRGLLSGFGAAPMGYALYEPTNAEKLQNAALSSAIAAPFGMFAPPVARMGGAVVNQVRDVGERLFTNKQNIEELINEGILSANQGLNYPSLLNANTQRQVTESVAARAGGLLDDRNFDPEAAVHREMAERFGYKDNTALTRAQATRDPIDLGTEEKLKQRKGGKAIAYRKNDQEKRSVDVMDEFANEYSDLGTPLKVEENLKKAIINRAKELQKEVKNAYDQIPTGYTVPGKIINDVFAKTMKERRDKIALGVKNRIKELSEKDVTVNEILELDRLISDLMPFEAANNAGNAAQGALKSNILDVLDTIAERESDETIKESLLNARTIARNRFNSLRAGKNSSVIQQLLRDKIESGDIQGKVIRAGLDDIDALKNLLGNDFRMVEALYADDILRTAVPDAQYSHPAYNRKITRGLGADKMQRVFGKDKANRYFDFLGVSRRLHTLPKQTIANPSGTGGAVADILGDVASVGLDIATPGFGAAQRVLRQNLQDAAEQASDKQAQRMIGGLLQDQPSLPRTNPVDIPLPTNRLLNRFPNVAGILSRGRPTTFDDLLRGSAVPVGVGIGSQ
tara:strand:+ start:85 stop:2193 length:2109 start_codon:yes stop_codon:yes gene_type:complete